MEARFCRIALIAACVLCSGANYRTQNFIVTAAPSEQSAREICAAAENYRRDLAIEWLGRELPPWQEPCPIKALVAPNLGAGGKTSFMFHDGVPFGWEMEVQGTRQRVLDSVLPHEVTHTIFATHFGRPLPRWADEGACTTVEDVSEKTKQHRLLHQFLTTGRGIPFNRMFAMKEYPRDILPLYSQGFSLARFLIAQGGKPKFVQYVGDGMNTNNWPAATRRHYGFSDLSNLQLAWLAWVKQGSPEQLQRPDGSAILAASAPPPAPADMTELAQLQNRGGADAPAPGPGPSPNPTPGADVVSRVARPVSDGWYAKRRDQVTGVSIQRKSPLNNDVPPSEGDDAGPISGEVETAAPPEATALPVNPAAGLLAPPAGERQVLLEWRRGENAASPRIARAAAIRPSQSPPRQPQRVDAAVELRNTIWR